MKIAIIGAGASGIIASIVAKRGNPNLDIALFDINRKIGKKILASGNGRCNITNKNLDETFFMGEDTSFVNYLLKQFGFKEFELFCNSLGLLLDIKADGKVYPYSNEAKSVVTLFELELNRLGIEVLLETKITSIQKESSKFILKSEEKSFDNFDKVLVSSGLGAYPQLNASTDGLNFAQNFGHKVNSPYASLVGLNAGLEYSSKLTGLKKESKVSLFINNQKTKEIRGDVLFTKYGLSGFAILDISQEASYNLEIKNSVKLSINFFPDLNKDELISKLKTILKAKNNQSFLTLLNGIVSNKLAVVLLELCGISKDIKAEDVNAKNIRAITNVLQNWIVQIDGTQGYKHAEVSGGGIKVSEVNSKTMESKKCKGLFFSGEILDITGKRGGYNLHFAWASGYVAGLNLLKK